MSAFGIISDKSGDFRKLCSKLGVEKLELFGSGAREDVVIEVDTRGVRASSCCPRAKWWIKKPSRSSAKSSAKRRQKDKKFGSSSFSVGGA